MAAKYMFLEKGIDRNSYDNNIRNLLYADEHTLFLVAKILLGSDLAKLLQLHLILVIVVNCVESV